MLFPNLNDVCRNDHDLIRLRYHMADEQRRRLAGDPPKDPEEDPDVDKMYQWYDCCLERHRCTPTIGEAASASSAMSSAASPTTRPRTSKGGKGDKDGKGTDSKDKTSDKKSKRGGPYDGQYEL